jgi:hypothetical protein
MRPKFAESGRPSGGYRTIVEEMTEMDWIVVITGLTDALIQAYNPSQVQPN